MDNSLSKKTTLESSSGANFKIWSMATKYASIFIDGVLPWWASRARFEPDTLY